MTLRALASTVIKMVSDQTRFRTKLQSKLFNRIGKSVTFKSRSSVSYNDRNEADSESWSTSTITIVPYSIIAKEQNYQPFGNLEAGELDAAVLYTVTVAIDDIMTIESVDYRVKRIEPNWLPDNVVTIVRLAKVQT